MKTHNKAKLIDKKSGAEIIMGSKRKDFRGETVTVLDFMPPEHEGSTGRVIVKDKGGFVSEYYPSVIDAKIII
jgi:hypothetical protein